MDSDAIIIIGAAVISIGAALVATGIFAKTKYTDTYDITRERIIRQTRVLATELINVLGDSRREYIISNGIIHLFVDRPIKHFCDLEWSYSGSRLYPRVLGCRKGEDIHRAISHTISHIYDGMFIAPQYRTIILVSRFRWDREFSVFSVTPSIRDYSRKNARNWPVNLNKIHNRFLQRVLSAGVSINKMQSAMSYIGYPNIRRSDRVILTEPIHN